MSRQLRWAKRMGSAETITVLITDLVGSTGLETRVGPSAADRALRFASRVLGRGGLVTPH